VEGLLDAPADRRPVIHPARGWAIGDNAGGAAAIVQTDDGVTCLDERTAWGVGWKPERAPVLPLGVIVSTTDGGEHWVQGSAPSDIESWKVSFAGARR
jgi:hypothetical protein